MTKPYQKPNHHRVLIQKLRDWRMSTNTDRTKGVCHYCDENPNRTGHLRCFMTCGDNYVWVDTVTMAMIELETT